MGRIDRLGGAVEDGRSMVGAIQAIRASSPDGEEKGVGSSGSACMYGCIRPVSACWMDIADGAVCS